MNQTPSPELMIKSATRMLPFERVALVLQGGGALGAYQAGVYQAIHEARIDVHWLCGTSIGAINGALIAGNPPDKRVERLRDFWETVTKPPLRIPNVPWFTELPVERQWPRAILDQQDQRVCHHGARRAGFLFAAAVSAGKLHGRKSRGRQLLRYLAAEGARWRVWWISTASMTNRNHAVHRSRHQCPHRRAGLF